MIIKILHMADLHMGKRINGFSMLDDQKYILDCILDYTSKHKPDVFIISGDIYDKPIPNTTAITLFDSFLSDLSLRDITVLVISGNHDSPERLSFASKILNRYNIFMHGVFDGKMQKVRLKDKFGAINFYLLPFVRPSFVTPYYDCEISSYDDAIKTILQNENLNKKERNVLVCHQFVVSAGKKPVLSDSEINPVGGMDSVDAYYMCDFDYVALGHIHGPQRIYRDYIRYAGSPLKYSFSESFHKKSLCIVELNQKDQDPNINFLPLLPVRDMRKIKGPFDQIIKKEMISNHTDYIHVTLTDEIEITDPIEKLRTVYPNIMSLAFENSRSKATYTLDEDMKLLQLSPLEMFESFYQAQNGLNLNESQQKILKNMLEPTKF